MTANVHPTQRARPIPADIAIATYMSVGSIFLYSVLLSKSPFMFFLPAAILMLCLVIMLFHGKIYLDQTIKLLIIAFIFHGIVGIILGFSTVLLLLKVLSKIVLYYLAFSTILKFHKNNVRKFVDIYLKMCVIIAYIGLFAALSYKVGFTLGYDFSWFLNGWHIAYIGGHFGLPRAQSIFAEPSHAGYAMGAAIFFAMGRLFAHQRSFLSMKGAGAILLFTFLTGSLTVYATFLVAVLFTIRLRLKTAIKWTGIVGGGLMLLILVVRPDFSTVMFKLEQTREIFIEKGQSEGITSSSYSLYVASLISENTFRDSYGFGGGIGSFEYAYQRLSNKIFANIEEGHVGNYQTGSSLTNRMLTELGLFGITLLLMLSYMVIKGMTRFSGDQRIIHLALSVAFVPFLVRQGTYQNHGLSLFLLLFLINYRQAKTLYIGTLKKQQ